VGRRDAAIRVYEYADAAPPWRLEGMGTAREIEWEPELRQFRLDSEQAGQFVLMEQYYPGWRATVDGRMARIERWNGAFQSIRVPAGSHTIRFEYLPDSLRAGAAISVMSLLALIIWRWRSRL
jgi:uncharacterized membrane protein YfhO